MTFQKYACWDSERIDKVFKKKALDVDDATFLATHMPMNNIVYEKSPLAIPHTSEEDFLSELERTSHQDQHVFAVIKGIPGTGKSHLIRWLAIRYEQIYPNEHVLLIERDNSSLKRTIEQILEKGIYGDDRLNEQSKKLENATKAISEEGLADTLLGHLQVATREAKVEKPVRNRRLAPEMISAFLLDQTVRDHLKRENGPVERIIRFLQEGRELSTNEMPEFEADDLIFDPRQKSVIRQEGYRNVLDVVDAISRSTSDRDREQLASYLNQLLKNYAISRTINLAATDLKDIFNSLRTALKSEGKNLALFIEDITAFTGIDEGLIDVLTNEHTTVGNKSLCRLTSVVGITDYYYTDSLNDHIYDRITHQLTLSSKDSKETSDMLSEDDAIIEFAARYLNAIRLNESDLHSWTIHTTPPSKCGNCDFREECHKAFGYVNVSSQEAENSDIGLYPFNKTSIVRMYRNLKNVKPTPRSLLDRILSYILQSHGDKVEQGKFPPPVDILAPSIKSQEFDPSGHGRLVADRGGDDADRLKTLFLFWGHRNIDEQGDHIGGLLPEVFQAFDVKTIKGRKDYSEEEQEEQEKTPEINEAIVKKQSDYIEDIRRWYDEGYLGDPKNNFVQWIAELFRTSIDWELYGISPNSYIKPSLASNYFAIEGQNATIYSKHFVFRKTPKLRYALDAIANLNDSSVTLSREYYGEYMIAIDDWLREIEPEVVDFITTLAPGKAVDNKVIERLLVQNAIIIGCLFGDIETTNKDESLYLQMIENTQTDNSLLLEKFTEITNDKKPKYPQKWCKLLKRIQKDRASLMVYKALPEYFNATQGDSTDVRFLHATELLQHVFEFEDSDWFLEVLSDDLPTTSSKWEAAIQVYEELHKSFNDVIEDAHAELVDIFEDLHNLFGNCDLTDMFVQIDEVLRQIQQTYPINPRYLYDLKELDVDTLLLLSEQVNHIKDSTSLSEKAKFLSKGYPSVVVPLKKYRDFFKRYVDEMKAVQHKIKSTDIMSSDEASTETLFNETKNLYQDIMQQLNSVVENGETD